MESKTSCLINSSRRFAAKAFASASSASTDWSFPRLSASADFGSSSVGFSSGFSSIVAFFSVMVLGFSSGLGMASGTSPLAISSGLAYPSSANKSSPSTMMMPSCAFCKDCFSSSSMETLLQSSSGISITSVWPSDLLRILWAESSLSGFSQWFIMASKNSVTPAALEQQMRMRPPINKDRPYKFKTHLVNGISRERLMGNSTMVDWAALRDGLSPESIRSTPARRRAWEKKIFTAHESWCMATGFTGMLSIDRSFHTFKEALVVEHMTRTVINMHAWVLNTPQKIHELHWCWIQAWAFKKLMPGGLTTLVWEQWKSATMTMRR